MSFFKFSDLPEAKRDFSVAIVVAEFNGDITEKLLDVCFKALKKCGISEDSIFVQFVPGAFELVFAAKKLAASGKYDGIVTIGAVIRGQTPHFDFVAGESARGVMDLNLSLDIPVIFGVLTCDDYAQAEARVEKGSDFAVAVVEMMNMGE